MTFPIFTKFGGRSVLHQLLVGAGYGSCWHENALRMWEARARIPGRPMIAIMKLAERHKIKYKSSDFEMPEKRHRRKAA